MNAHVQAIQLRNVPIRRIWHREVVQVGVVCVVRQAIDKGLKSVEQHVRSPTLEAENAFARLAASTRLEGEKVRVESITTQRTQRPRKGRLVLPE